MKISIITATLNNKAGLIRAIESVRSQTYKNVEHIIIDGGSTDGSLEILRTEIRNQKSDLQSPISDLQSLVSISEADSGIYDAINKGIKLATGDVIGLLHSDDYYKDDFVLEKYAELFEQYADRKTERESKDQSANYLIDNIDAVYSDLVYISSDNSILRYWKTQEQEFATEVQRHRILENGWMPPHPTLFIRKNVFDKCGYYRTDMKIAADYEMILRLFYKYKIHTRYLPITTYCMSTGGVSNKSIKNILLKSKEDYRAIKMHSLPDPVKTLALKNLSKISQFFRT